MSRCRQESSCGSSSASYIGRWCPLNDFVSATLGWRFCWRGLPSLRSVCLTAPRGCYQWIWSKPRCGHLLYIYTVLCKHSSIYIRQMPPFGGTCFKFIELLTRLELVGAEAPTGLYLQSTQPSFDKEGFEVTSSVYYITQNEIATRLGGYFILSCWRGLNSWPLPYQGSALPLSYNSNWLLKRCKDIDKNQLCKLFLQKSLILEDGMAFLQKKLLPFAKISLS